MKQTYNLRTVPHRSTISRIIRQKGVSRKREGRQIECAQLETELVQWVWEMYRKNIAVTEDLIKVKGSRILETINSSKSESEQIHMQFSNGWLHSFKNRNHFKKHRTHGESFNLNVEGIAREYQTIVKKYLIMQ